MATHEDEAATADAPPVEQMVVHWYGTVEKIGRQLSSHTRVIFVTDRCVFVCLPSGGVTRTMPLRGLKLAYRSPGSVAQLFESGKATLVTKHGSDRERDAYLDHVGTAIASECGTSLGIDDVASYAFEPQVSHAAEGAASTLVTARAPGVRVGNAPSTTDALEPPNLPQGVARAGRLPSPPRADSQQPSARTSSRQSPARTGDAADRAPADQPRNPFETTALDEFRRTSAEDIALHRVTRDDDRAPQDGRGGQHEVHPSLVLRDLRAESVATDERGERQPVIAVGQRPSKSPSGHVPPASSAPQPTDIDFEPTASRRAAAVSEDPGASPGRARPSPSGATAAALQGTPRDTGFRRRHETRDAQIADLQHAMANGVDVVDSSSLQTLQRRVDQQQAVIDAMKHDAETTRVNELKRELDHAHSLIADLQTALRSQETTFAEMLRAQEQLRASQAIQASQEAQLTALKAERDALRAEGDQVRSEAERTKAELDASARQHDRELAKVREAFVQYDANVAEYLEEVRLDHADEIERLRASHRDDARRRQGQAAPEGATTAQRRDPNQNAEQSASGVPPDALRSALMRHLNSYANARLNLPVGHPLPPGTAVPEFATPPPSHRDPLNGAHLPRGATPRDRAVL